MVEGLDNVGWLPEGSFAILTRMHHAAEDGTAAAALLATAGKMISTVGFDTAGTGRRQFNIGISNVPGPNVPLYLKGAQLKYWSIVAPLADGMGTVFAITSYNGELFVCPTACREIVPDPDFLVECIQRSYREMAGCVGKKAPRRKRATRKRSSTTG